MSELPLYVPIKAGYQTGKKQRKTLAKYGYKKDKALSNDNQQTYYNKTSNKLLLNVSGTHNISDIGNDIFLGLGKIKDTDRYKSADNTLKDAKQKYGVDNATITSHSLGTNIANGIGSSKDKIYGLDGGYTFGQKSRSNVVNYRTKGDLVSTLAPPKNTITLENPNASTGIIPIDILKAHNVDNIKKSPIFI